MLYIHTLALPFNNWLFLISTLTVVVTTTTTGHTLELFAGQNNCHVLKPTG